MRSAAADAVLLVHLMFVIFVTAGLAAVWVGALMHWGWVRNRAFRMLHLAAIAFVAAESLGGIACPLTVWEDALRGRSGEVGFVARWVRELLFYDWPAWVFTAAYVVFAGLVLLTFWLVPPDRAARRRAA